MPPSLPRWQRLSDPAAGPLIEAAADTDPGDVNAVAALRRRYDAEDVHAALELADARRRGVAKFGDLAEAMMLDRVGVEQASALDVARVKAGRLRELAGPGEAWDLCCGVGADAMALAEAGFELTAIDRNALRAWQTRSHVRLLTQREAWCRADDVIAVDVPSDAAVHLDPDRRPGGRRRLDAEQYTPGLDFARRLAERPGPTAVKLAPGVPASVLPGGSWQWISDAGRLVQAVWWSRPFDHATTASPAVRATLVAPGGAAYDLTGEPGRPPPADLMGRYVYEADPAAERARLLPVLCERHALAEAHPGLGLLTGDEPADSPWLTGFEVLYRVPWRDRQPKRVQEVLAQHDAGIVEVKTRDKACDPDVVQKQLRGRGQQTLTVFVLRLGRRVEAWLTKRQAASRH